MFALLKFLVGLCAVAALGALAVTLEVIPGSAGSAERRLQKAATESLADDVFSWARVRMDGQTAHIEGAAPSPEAGERAKETVRASAGPGGVLLGGVTIIDGAALTVTPRPPAVDPFLWIAERQGASVVLSGHAPSLEAREDVFSHARRAFPEADISGELDIAGGGPREDRWTAAAFLSLDALARLENGAVEANGATFTLSGEAADQPAANAAQLIMSALPQSVMGRSLISIAPAPEAPPPGPQTALDEQPDQVLTETCSARLSRLVAARRISFASARSVLDEGSQTHLRDIAAAMTDCPRLKLRIGGHTDSSGGATRNRQLSEARANAVAAFLRTAGVSSQRLEAQGFGETRPLVSNATPEGRARNRRIEFTVINEPTP